MGSPLTATIAARIRLELARRSLSQVALAECLGIRQQSVSAKLRGQSPFSLDQLHAVAGFLQVPVTDLVAADSDQRAGAAR
jgi:transcriptional regulator with XRE-family HTH domain